MLSWAVSVLGETVWSRGSKQAKAARNCRIPKALRAQGIVRGHSPLLDCGDSSPLSRTAKAGGSSQRGLSLTPLRSDHPENPTLDGGDPALAGIQRGIEVARQRLAQIHLPQPLRGRVGRVLVGVPAFLGEASHP